MNVLLLLSFFAASQAVELPLRATQEVHYPYVLPKLDYGYGDLEPFVDTQTMRIHHTKHQQAYIDKLNAALKNHPELHAKSLEQLLAHLDQVPKSIRRAVRNNGGGHYNHTFFFKCLSPNGGSEPRGELLAAITKKYGSIEKFKESFEKAAQDLFGSGWTWLCSTTDGTLSIITTANQETPLALNLIPIVNLDEWEHAYYLKHQNKRNDWISTWWNVVNWHFASANYDKILEKIKQKKHASH